MFCNPQRWRQWAMFVALSVSLFAPASAQSAVAARHTLRLLVTLPDYCPTPDAVAVDADGNLIVACPNYADPSQPGEPILWNGKLVVTCFDVVTGRDKVNTKHDKPYTISCLELD